LPAPQSRTLVCQTQAAESAAPGSQNYKFTGKERDPETNNDDFDARYYSSAYGRFLSADWSSAPTPVPYANLTNPQTLNLYAMVSDNPESFADLNGHIAVHGECWTDSAGCASQETPSTTTNDQNGPQTAPTTQNSDLVVEPRQSDIDKKPAPDGGGGKTKDVTYDVKHVHSNADGTATTSSANTKDDGDHHITLTENFSAGSKPQPGTICSAGCTDRNVNTMQDHMDVTPGHPESVDKHFKIDGNDAKVYDPATRTTHDYIRVDASVKSGFVFTYKDNPQHP
jgi:RHS repeat-associated protein